MNLSKSHEFFKPESVGAQIHIIGCGSVGSTVAENLARCGVTDMVLWDFDTVESKNIVNQMFRQQDVGRPKVEALQDILREINPDIRLTLKPAGWQGEILSGYLFIAVDNIELRRRIAQQHLRTPFVKAVFDFRTGLTDAQHFAADWSKLREKQNFLKTMQFSHEDAMAQTPVSACGITLGVATTCRMVSLVGVNNFINFINSGNLKRMATMDAFSMELEAY